MSEIEGEIERRRSGPACLRARAPAVAVPPDAVGVQAGHAATPIPFNRATADWERSASVLLSHFAAHPFLLDWCEPLAGLAVLELGCGDGEFSRALRMRGAGRLEAVDSCAEEIGQAIARESDQPLGISFRVGDPSKLARYADASFDLVVAMFLLDDLDRDRSDATMREARRVLRPGGRFAFAVPHPARPRARVGEPPFYLSHRAGRTEAGLWRLDDDAVPVKCVHRTLDDHFARLRSAGFTATVEARELHVTSSHVAVDPVWFAPLKGQPLLVAFRSQA